MNALLLSVILLAAMPSFEEEPILIKDLPDKAQKTVRFFESLDPGELELTHYIFHTDPEYVEFRARFKKACELEVNFSVTGKPIAVFCRNLEGEVVKSTGMKPPTFTRLSESDKLTKILVESLSKHRKILALYKDKLTDRIWSVVVDSDDKLLLLVLKEEAKWEKIEVLWPCN